MRLVVDIKKETLILTLKAGKKTDHENLTISQGFDKLLVTAIDKLLARNKIDRLSLKSLEIRGKIKEEAVSGMVLKAISSAVRV